MAVNDDDAIAVVGAAGFIGTHTLRRLSGAGKVLRCFSRRIPADHAKSGLNWVEGSISDRKKLIQTIQGCGAVVHLASTATPMSASKNVVEGAEEGILPSLQLFDACVAAGVRRVILVSSGGTVYGMPSTVPTPEDAPTNPISAYGVGKVAIEQYLKVYQRQYGLDYRILRVANVYGPLQSTLKNQGVVASFVERALQGRPLEIWGDGKVIRDYVYVEDVAELIAAALSHRGEGRIFNIGSSEGLSLLDIVAILSQLLASRLQCTHHTASPHDVPISILDCSRARTELGWQPRTPFVDGLRQTLEWRRADSKVLAPNISVDAR